MSAEAFEILAEVAIGIAGFGSIAIVIGQNRRDWESADFYRTSSFFMSSLGALFLALLPIGLTTTGLAPAALWRSCSSVMLIYLVLITVLGLIWRRRYLERALWFGPLLMSVVIIGSTGSSGGLLWNVLRADPGPAAYFFGVLWLLMFACIFFIRIVFVRPLAQ